MRDPLPTGAFRFLLYVLLVLFAGHLAAPLCALWEDRGAAEPYRAVAVRTHSARSMAARPYVGPPALHGLVPPVALATLARPAGFVVYAAVPVAGPRLLPAWKADHPRPPPARFRPARVPSAG